jgi:type I restriction enzyme M protein
LGYSVALSGQFFYSTQISVCIWFLAENKAANAKRRFRECRKQTLFIDARKLGTPIVEFNSVDCENSTLALAA